MARARKGTSVAFLARIRKARASGCLGTTYKSRDKLLTILGWGSYGMYLRSRLWSSIRRMVYRLKGKSCCKCGAPASALHHQSYDLDTLAGRCVRHIYPICSGCHKKVEFDEDGDKRDFKSARATFRAMPGRRPVVRKRGRHSRRK
jgi:hypothetical protein